VLELELKFYWALKLDASKSISEIIVKFLNVVLVKDGEDQVRN
jgi:hypothetical protein